MDKKEGFSHLDESGKAKIVDITFKEPTLRTARASGKILLDPQIISAIGDDMIKKGDVLGVSKIAGIMAAKKTWELIPLCHQINITDIKIMFKTFKEENSICVESLVKGYDKSGVEMEALTAVSVCLLTIYDMCKAFSKDLNITEIRLLSKSGGKSAYEKDV
jgi:molybdenum cofactor biosynthesis protein MoaC